MATAQMASVIETRVDARLSAMLPRTLAATPAAAATPRTRLSLSIQGRLTTGTDPVEQAWFALISAVRGAAGPAEIRARIESRYANLAMLVLRPATAAPLALDSAQRATLASLAAATEDSLASVRESLITALQERRGGVPIQELAASAQRMTDHVREERQRVLRAGQWQSLPPALQHARPPALNPPTRVVLPNP